MYLRSIRVENYRAIREGFVSFLPTTLLFGENDSGRSSILEALLLILGSPSETFESGLRPLHFHRAPDGRPGPLLIRLDVAESVIGQWTVPESLQRPLRFATDQPRRLQFDFRAELDEASNAIHTAWSFQNFASPASSTAGTPEQLAWLRELVPALWLRQGWITSPAGPAFSSSFARDPALDELLIRIERHHRNLLSGESPDLIAELENGALAARDLLERSKGVFTGAGPLMSAMASELLSRRETPSTAELPGASAANKIAMLLLLGAIIQLLRRRIVPQCKPVLVIENPEANLHPMTLAAVWRIIERILWQKVVTTNSGTILSCAPLSSLRRLTRNQGVVTEWFVSPRALSKDNLRRVSYHLRSRRAAAMFARSWLLVEGETEFWVLPELARICGYDLAAEGVVCVEFAQCGLAPLTKLADQLGIAWHVLVDGDEAGRRYSETALHLKRANPSPSRSVFQIRERDIEHCFWANGFAPTIQAIAYPNGAPRASSPSSVIRKAIERSSKPHLALSLLDAVAGRGSQSIPPVLRTAIDSCVAAARSAPPRPRPL